MPLDATPAATGDGTTRVELQTPITDERSAASAIEGLLDWDNEGQAAGNDNPSGAEAPDPGPDESQTAGLEDEGQTEPPATATVEPPPSWSAEDKALFATLPPTAQAVIARRESEQQATFTRRTQEIADERKGWEAERTAIATHREQYNQSLQQLMLIAVPEAEALSRVDWQTLAAQNPAEYVRLSAQRDALRQRIGAVQAEIQRVQRDQIAELEKQRGPFLAEQQQRLMERVPEFADPAKRTQLAGELNTWLQREGFTATEIGQVVDHRLISLAVKAMRADQADAARKTAEAKRANTAPAVQRPGTAAAQDDGAGKVVRDKIQRFGRTNSVRDAASLLMDIL